MAAGIEDDLVAGVARLIGQLVAFGGLPEGLVSVRGSVAVVLALPYVFCLLTER